jgi:nascent polypeptide-associated complex subunit alpha
MTVISEIPPEQEVAAQEKAQDVSDSEEKGHSRGEKKARKALSKLGLKLQADISRVTFKRAKNVIIF